MFLIFAPLSQISQIEVESRMNWLLSNLQGYSHKINTELYVWEKPSKSQDLLNINLKVCRNVFFYGNSNSDNDLNGIEKPIFSLEEFATLCNKIIAPTFVLFAKRDNTNTYFIGKNRTGNTTCYYTILNDLLIVGDSAKLVALISLNNNTFRINTNFLLSYILASRRLSRHTPFENVFELLPGECIEISNIAIKKRFFWSPFDLLTKEKTKTYQVSSQSVRKIFIESLKQSLSRACNVHLELSGGIDSSCLLAALHIIKNEGIPLQINPVHLSYPSTSSANELSFATQLCNKLGYQLTIINGDEYLPFTPSPMPFIPDYPSADIVFSAQNNKQFQIAQRNNSEIFVRGTGGDQVMGATGLDPIALLDYFGEMRFQEFLRELRLFAINHSIPYISLIKSLIHNVLTYTKLGNYRNFEKPNWINKDVFHLVIQDYTAIPNDIIPYTRFPFKTQLALESFQLSCYLPRGWRGRFEIAESYPFNFPQMIDLGLHLDIRNKFLNCQDRVILRQAFADILPGVIVNRWEKGDHGGIIQLGLRSNLSSISALVSDGLMCKLGFVQADLLILTLNQIAHGAAKPVWSVVDLIALELWLESLKSLGYKLDLSSLM